MSRLRAPSLWSPSLRSLSLRTRLVAGFACAMLVVLLGAGVFIYWRVEFGLDRELDATLAQAQGTIQPLIRADGNVVTRERADATGVGWQVLAGDGHVLASGGLLAGKTPVPAHDLRTGTHIIDVGTMLPISAEPLRVQVTSLGSGRAAYLALAIDRNHRDEALRELLAQLAIAGLGALAITTIVGDVLARAALRPVERYRTRAEEITDGALDLRLDVPAERDDEVTRLGRTLNDMLDSLEAAVERERRFVSEASHELRTPLALLRGRIQLTRRRSRTVAEHERSLAELEVDTDRLVALAGQLLEFGTPSPAGTADLVSVAQVLVRRLAAAGRTGVDLDPRVEVASVACAAEVIDRILGNLVTNAFVHGAEPISITIDVQDCWAVARVADAGPGMPPDLLQRATQRFTRAAEARARPGAGLGLSLVDHLVREAHGELRLCSRGAHVSSGVPTGIVCDHGPEMTVSVYLPLRR